jgi:hypothetical protein
MYIKFLITILSVSICLLSISGTPDCNVHDNIALSHKSVADNSAILRITGKAKSWLPKDITTLRIQFEPPLTQDIDFTIWSEPHLYHVPDMYQYHNISNQTLFLALLPGKSWMPSVGKSGEMLVVKDIYCVDSSGNRYTTGEVVPVTVARIHKGSRNCPSLSNLPNCSSVLQREIDSVLNACQDPMIIASKKLYWRKYNSWNLLRMQPRFIFVDGSDQDLYKAAKSVDNFLAAHGVLSVVWEPLSLDHPLWWVLAVRPLGMPGNLFAILDTLQWRNPLISRSELHSTASPCTRNEKGCIPGCANTKVTRITGSGYSADTFNVYSFLRKALQGNLPVQVSPCTLGRRATPPLWEGIQGWIYTFDACPSHFLDCYFLDHSPCPHIRFDIENIGLSGFNNSRRQLTDINQEAKPSWWSDAVGYPTDNIPDRSIQDLTQGGIPSRHVLYSYLFRPNYSLRRDVQIAMSEFLRDGDLSSCAVMHVRRGDVVFHSGAARSYLPVEVYVRAARPYLDELQIKTIFLLTDSQLAVQEALNCEKDYPGGACDGIKWRYVNKHRWVAAEGGWENPFPSGNSRTEFLNIQLEFALSQRCDLGIFGGSGFGEMVYAHMCCGFPIDERGVMPHRCICPPKVRLEQGSFDCKAGNLLLCGDPNRRGGDITRPLNDPDNMAGANFSFTRAAFRNTTKVWYTSAHREMPVLLHEMNTEENIAKITKSAKQAKVELCKQYDNRSLRGRSVCLT